VDVRLLRRRPVALVEVVELVERLVAERLQRRQRAGGARERGLEREGGDDRERLAAERQGLRRARGTQADRLRLDRAEARRELLREDRREHLARKRRVLQLE